MVSLKNKILQNGNKQKPNVVKNERSKCRSHRAVKITESYIAANIVRLYEVFNFPIS